MLEAAGLSIAVPGRSLCKGLDLHIETGQCWAILGPNGCGKTTLLHTLGGLQPVQGGQVSLCGNPLSTYRHAELARHVGMLLQEDGSGFWGNVGEFVLLGRFPHGDRDITITQAAMQRCEVETLAARRYASLSGGERQRVRLAQLLSQAPQLYLLDEPMQHLDLRHQAAAMEWLRALAGQGENAVAMVLHEPWWAQRYCSHALLLFGDGTTMSGPVAAMLIPENLEKLYGWRPPQAWTAFVPDPECV